MSEREDAIVDPGRRPEGGTPSAREGQSFAKLARNPRVGPSAIVALAALIGLVVWLVVESGGGSSSKSNANANPPVALNQSGLTTLAGAVGQPIYWVGASQKTVYELTKTPTGIYLRYLPQGAKAGDPTPRLTIGTYPMQNAYSAMKTSATGPGTTTFDVPGGGIAVINKQRTTSVYVAFPGSDYQVEVYDPSPAYARRLAASGQVRPVVEGAQSQSQTKGPVAVSPRGLSSIAASLGHAVYWVGPRPGVTYELVQTADGRTFVRYLPKGVAVGAKKNYLTIGTYPLANAFNSTKDAAKEPSAVTINLPKGGIAVYTKHHATNIHLAYPSSDVQIEVYDPSPSVPPKLVSSGRVVPVG